MFDFLRAVVPDERQIFVALLFNDDFLFLFLIVIRRLHRITSHRQFGENDRIGIVNFNPFVPRIIQNRQRRGHCEFMNFIDVPDVDVVVPGHRFHFPAFFYADAARQIIDVVLDGDFQPIAGF